MTNFENIKAMSINELAALLCQLDEGYCYTPWIDWFDNNYCKKCEPIREYVEHLNRELDFSWCELNDRCKFFSDLGDVPDCECMARLWLESEVE